jgi:hypothetical protein
MNPAIGVQKFIEKNLLADVLTINGVSSILTEQLIGYLSL